MTWLSDALARYDINGAIYEIVARLDFLEQHCTHGLMLNDGTGQNRVRCIQCGVAKEEKRIRQLEQQLDHWRDLGQRFLDIKRALTFTEPNE
jgi:hypothetical protein